MGTLDCRRHIFDTSLNLGLNGPTRLHRYGIHSLWLSETAPFGLVALEYLSENQEVGIEVYLDKLASGEIQFRTMSGSSFERLELQAVERNVTSIFSDDQ